MGGWVGEAFFLDSKYYDKNLGQCTSLVQSSKVKLLHVICIPDPRLDLCTAEASLMGDLVCYHKHQKRSHHARQTIKYMERRVKTKDFVVAAVVGAGLALGIPAGWGDFPTLPLCLDRLAIFDLSVG